ncbi:MAG: two-component system response regulator RppA [Pseudanabaena sp. ELA607]
MRILLVDDEAELIKPLQRILSNEGYAVDIATDGAQGWQLVQNQAYDLLILDWLMPEMSGLEICQQLRQLGNQTPILFLTAKDTLDDRVMGLDSGADDYLIKPFDLRELLARVRAWLRRKEMLMESTEAHRESAPAYVPSEKIAYGDLVLDMTNQVLYQGGKTIALSEKEFQLLRYFLQHPEQLLSHEQISQYLWHNEPPLSNALVAQIKLLRRKIDPANQPSFIQTVYGKGYRFGKP